MDVATAFRIERRKKLLTFYCNFAINIKKKKAFFRKKEKGKIKTFQCDVHLNLISSFYAFFLVRITFIRTIWRKNRQELLFFNLQ